MGEVYRAIDTKLKRQVAIKVLPEAVATDAERRARFQREAEVLALNYPNVAIVYGLEKGTGATASRWSSSRVRRWQIVLLRGDPGGRGAPHRETDC